MKLRSIIVATICCCLSQIVPAQTAVEQHGQLRVSNGQIIDQHNEAPQLHGLSFSWSIWNGQKYYNEEVVDWICADFKTNLIRVSMGIEPKGGYLNKPEFQKELVTTVIDRALKNGVYVIIDWHDHHAEKHTEDSKAFFAKIAQRYQGNPQIIYEIFNEPEYQSWEAVKEYALQVIPVIRQYDKENLIVVGSPHWDQDVDVAANSPITGFDNICYSFHFYASDKSHQEQLRQKANNALMLGLPLFVTEWGVGEADGDGKFDKALNQVWIEWMTANQLSWVCWNITDKKETTAFLKPGASIHGQWTENELTPNGIYLRELLRKLSD